MATRAKNKIRCLVAITAALFIAGTTNVVGQPAAQGEASPAQFRDNQRIVTEADGKKILLTRWAIGARERIITLRRPREFVPFFSMPSINYPDPNFRQPFMTTALFDAMLWDMQPVPRNKELPRAEGNTIVHGIVESIFSGTRVRTEVDQLHSIASTRLRFVYRNYYQTRYNLQILQKPNLHGLRRLGAIHKLGRQTPVGLDDFYYTGDDPEKAADFLTCTDEQVPDDPPPGWNANPGCQQWFALPELSATVRVTYRRRHVAEWREIKRFVTDLLLLWKQPENAVQ